MLKLVCNDRSRVLVFLSSSAPIRRGQEELIECRACILSLLRVVVMCVCVFASETNWQEYMVAISKEVNLDYASIRERTISSTAAARP